MFWLYCSIVLIPAICFNLYMNRDGDDFVTGFMWGFWVAAVQVVLLVIDGPISLSLAGLVFAFGAFLGYGAWYMPRLEEMAVIPEGDYVIFNYVDRLGRGSKRRVLVSSSDNTYFEGICSTRNANRTFRRSRVQGGLTVESTGEIIDPNAPAHPNLHKK